MIRHADRTAWLCQQSMSRDEFDAIETPEGWSKLGIGGGLHDVAFFRRSSGKPEPGFEGVTVLPVYKHHRVGFVAGRTISILDTGDSWQGPLRLDLPS